MVRKKQNTVPNKRKTKFRTVDWNTDNSYKKKTLRKIISIVFQLTHIKISQNKNTKTTLNSLQFFYKIRGPKSIVNQVEPKAKDFFTVW